MTKDNTMPTGRASLCALGEYLRRHCFFAPLREQVHIPQKKVRYRPVEKVLDGLLGILCGAKTSAQSNGTMRLDPVVQRACGRTGCAEQSTIARTLQASTAETVDQLRRGLCMSAWKSPLLPVVILTLPLVVASVLHAASRDTCAEMMYLLDQKEGALLLAFPEVQHDESFHSYTIDKDKAFQDITAGHTQGEPLGVVKEWKHGDALYHEALRVRRHVLELLHAQGHTQPFADAPAGDMASAAMHVYIERVAKSQLKGMPEGQPDG